MDLIVILSGELVFRNGKWRTASYNDFGEPFGIDGHRLRLEAGASLFFDNPGSKIVVMGGRGFTRNQSDLPILSSIMKGELVELGVPVDSVREEVNSNTTFDQLVEIQRILTKDKNIKVRIISNEWHLPRIETMIGFLTELSEVKIFLEEGRVKIVGAEDVLLKKDHKKWDKIIQSARASKEMANKIQSEKKGVSDIMAGKYIIRRK